MSRRTIDIAVPHSSFIERVQHDGHGRLTVRFVGGTHASYRAPIQAADQAVSIVESQEQGIKRSIGKWYNASVKRTYPAW